MPEAKEPVILSPEKIPQHADDTDVLVDKIIGMVKGYSPNANTDMIYVAYKLAKSAHSHQFRRSGAPYIEHPVQLAYIAAQLSLDATAISAALLHDVVEDTPYTYENIETIFGKSVAELVDGVTKLRKIKYNTREEQQVENLRKMFLAMAKDIRVVIIKLIDRLHNMRTLNFMPRAKQLLISKETLDVYAPLAHRLGMSKIKIELEDLALKYLDPVAYEEIRQSINQKKDEREKYIRDIMDVLREKLDQMDIKSQVTGRAKHFYSIYKKMKNQGKTLSEIYDLTALRVIVKSLKECYSVLGAIHAQWKPIPGRFKDYIAVPKPNLYQSLHTTVITEVGMPFEIQIRTEEMHKVAEYGIAAHWKYKEGITGVSQLDGKLNWIKEVLVYEGDLKDSKEFLDLIRRDISISNEVYCFTPKGDVRNLTAGATALDFAYAIHSEVGNKCVGVKVNSKIVPLDKVLENGDVVEVLISSNSKGPSRDWLKIVKTSGAKAKIRQFFKRELRDENIKTGKSMLEREAKRHGVELGKLLTPEAVNNICERYRFASLEEVYAAVGYGGVSINQIMFKLLNINNVQTTSDEQENRARVLRKSGKGNMVEIKGYDDFLVRFSRCCSPVPGDEIVGYISRGRGVCLHRADCHTLKSLEKERLVEAHWINKNSENTFGATIQIVMEDKVGAFAELTKVIAAEKLPIMSINARKDRNKNAIAVVTVEITNHEQLNQLIARLETLPNTIKVFRTTM